MRNVEIQMSYSYLYRFLITISFSRTLLHVFTCDVYSRLFRETKILQDCCAIQMGLINVRIKRIINEKFN